VTRLTVSDSAILVFLAAAYSLAALSVAERSRIRRYVAEAWVMHGIIFAAVMTIISIVTFASNALHNLVTHNGTKPRAIELWSIGSTLVTIAALRMAPCSSVFMLIWPVLRYADIVLPFVRVLGRERRPRTVPRAISLLLLHYAEVILLAACLHLYLQAAAGPDHLYAVASAPRELDTGEAIFFSLVTASTIGFGDITPNHNLPGILPACVYSVVWIQLLTIITITAIELPRLIPIVDKNEEP
jgi:hypothetical protein